jgi:hypothetical protein
MRTAGLALTAMDWISMEVALWFPIIPDEETDAPGNVDGKPLPFRGFDGVSESFNKDAGLRRRRPCRSVRTGNGGQDSQNREKSKRCGELRQKRHILRLTGHADVSETLASLTAN